jgi:hypothetical protein
MSRGLIALLLAAAILVGMAGAANYSLEPNIYNLYGGNI